MKCRVFGLVLVVGCLLSFALQAEEGARVELFSPQGTVKGVRQANCRFSEQMVPFGDPRGQAAPFAITCSEKGTGRWADGRTWSYDFDRDLPAGIRCEFRLKQGLKSLAGKEVFGQKVFSFSTGGPAVINSYPYAGDEWIDEDQVFVLTLDAKADPDSVTRCVSFSIDGIQDLAGIRIIEGAAREEILKARYRDEKPPEVPLILVQCIQRFPSQTKVSLIWGAGVTSESGVATEQEQVLGFKVREPFTARFSCEKTNARAQCIPILPMSVYFSESISREQAEQVVLKGPGGKVWKPTVTEDEVGSITFEGPFPESTTFTVELPAGLKDDAGRTLSNADKFPLTVKTDTYPPLAKFSSRFGILELKAHPVLPITVRNLEPALKGKIVTVQEQEGMWGRVVGTLFNLPPARAGEVQAWLRKVAAAAREKPLLAAEEGVTALEIPKPRSDRSLEVIGIPMEKPGLYVVELESTILGKALLVPPKPMYVPAAVLVTNLSVHFKRGRETSLVWVTTLDTGAPVKGALVTLRDCGEKVIWEGTTDASGIARVDQRLPSDGELPQCPYRNDYFNYTQLGALKSLGGGLFVIAQTTEDMAFVHSSWDEGIEPWRFQLSGGGSAGNVIAHTVCDRSLLRAGESVHMKHLLRLHTLQGMEGVAAARLPETVSIEHSGSEQKYQLPLQWDGSGVAESIWTIPRDAKLGSYQVVLRKKPDPGKEDDCECGIASGTFRVEEFRVPLMKGMIQPPAAPLVRAESVGLDLSVHYLAGGGAASLPVKLRAEVGPKYLQNFAGFEGFTFGQEPVKEGITRRGEDLEGEEAQTRGGRKQVKLPSMDMTLDRSGACRTTLSNLPTGEMSRELFTELEYKDPNGETQTVASRIPLWHSKVLVGIKAESWVGAKNPLRFQAAVVDLEGKPLAGTFVKVDAFAKKTFSHRKRLVGGFYSYDNSVEVRKVSTLCEGKTDDKGVLDVEVQVPVSGNLIIQAESSDEAGNKSFTCKEVWVAGKEEWWFEANDHDRIDLIPEKKQYERGETARFQVRMPFREATALVSVEREGVADAWVARLSGKEPVIEVPIKGTYAPNIFVSALVVRGRAAGVAPTAMVDLGKPAYKLGIAEIKVGWKEHELKVLVTPDEKVYKVRQKAKVAIKVTTAEGTVTPPGSEVAIAAVDEGLLELMPNESWELLPHMMKRRGYEVHTATAQMQVIGKRHFGMKALPQGGGGGRQATRELFDTLLFWKARQALDAKGEALVEIPLNDSVTSFRIAAVAQGGVGLFGSGFASVRSTQDLMVFSGLPPVVREEDRFGAEFTLRNTTEHPMDVQASATVEGLAEELKPLDVSLAPGEAKEVSWDVTVPLGKDTLLWEVEMQKRGSDEQDRLKVVQKVVPAVPVKTYQATIVQLAGECKTTVAQPKDALPGRGGVQTSFKPKISRGLAGVIEYMKHYPYTCMEQKISVAVALRDEAQWNKWMAALPAHLDADGLVKYFPCCTYGCPILTSYIIAIGHEAGWTIPAESKANMESGLRKFVEGSILRTTYLRFADLSLRKLTAIEALSRSGSTDAQLLGSIAIEPNLWPTSAVLDWLNILGRMEGIPDRKQRQKEAEQIIRSRLNFQGTTMGFSTAGTDYLWWLMVSNDGNAVRALLTLLGKEGWKEDMPRLVQGALGRQYRGAWDLTVANAWGVLAMEKFSKAFEAETVSGTTAATLASESQTIDWGANPEGGAASFPWPRQEETLLLSHQGGGKPWATVQSLAALPLKVPLFTGYRITRTFVPVEQKNPPQWSRGDIARIRLELEAQADQTWVVVSDPIPGGASILGSGLGRDSQLLTEGEKKEGWVWPAYEERSFEAFRAYYEFVPKGKWTVEYTVRLNQAGTFQLPTTRVESLYHPEMLGELPNERVEVKR